MIGVPSSSFAPWFSQLAHLAATLSSHSGLPVHEIEKAKVLKKHAKIRPLPNSSVQLGFSAWKLAHAIKKADCARWRANAPLFVSASGFLIENAQLFAWNGEALALNDGASEFLADFSGTSLAGRVAQGMALLFLESKGYSYVGRFEAEWKKRAATQNKAWPKGKMKAPDFIAENAQKEWILAESKGGFPKPEGKPNIKGALNEGLSQLDGWDKYITPQPSKSFVVGTFLRESGDISAEKSLLAFVDPEPDEPEDPVEFPRDAVRRANYASWLSLMGFDSSASRLLGSIGEPQRRTVPVISLAGRNYAVRIASVSPKFRDPSSPDFWHDFDEFLFHPHWMFRNGLRIEVMGIDFSVLKILGSRSQAEITQSLLELTPQESSDDQLDAGRGNFYGSIFSDGTLLGELRINRPSMPMPEFEWMEVEI
ncbi:MAG: hypothetical protein H6847_14030 [Hyphomonas sp.]|nr:hypothetical protein [Hyphomonas sp.]